MDTKSKTIDFLNTLCKNSLIEHLEMEFYQGNDSLPALKMPVNMHTKQVFGQLHGGASIAMAETLAGAASMWIIPDGFVAMGTQVNASHLQWVDKGQVYASAQAVVIKPNWHIWDITIKDDDERLIAVVRVQNKIIEKLN